MAIALSHELGSTSNFNSVGPPTTIVLTTTATAAVGEFIVVRMGSHRTGALSSVTDSAGNTYALDVNTTSGQNSNFFIASAQVTSQLASGGTITATWAAGVANRYLSASAYTGIATSSALDKTAKANDDDVNWSSGATATTTQADELLVGGCTQNTSADLANAPTSPWNEIDELHTSDDVNFVSQYQIVAATGAYACAGTWSGGSAAKGTAAIATYKAASGETTSTSSTSSSISTSISTSSTSKSTSTSSTSSSISTSSTSKSTSTSSTSSSTSKSTSTSSTSSSTSVSISTSSTSSSISTSSTSTSISTSSTSSSTSTSKSTSTSSTSNSTSLSTSVSTSSTSSSLSTSSTSSSTSTTVPPDSGGLAFGEQNPTMGESPVSWRTWDDDAGGAVSVSGDADWGKLNLSLGQEGRSKVYDFGNSDSRLYTLTPNRYGIGQGVATPQIRGDTTIFTQDDNTVSWENYLVPITRSWRYVQVRESK